MKINYVVFIFLTLTLFFSCSTSNILLNIPTDTNASLVETVSIKGVKGKGIPGSKRRLKFNHSFSGTIKEGWNISTDIFDKSPDGIFSAEATRRSLLSNIGLDVNDVVSKTSDTYQFSLSDTVNAVLVFCNQQYTGKSTNYKTDRKADFSIASRQASKFAVRMFPVTTASMGEWQLDMGYDRATPGGVMATTVKEGMPVENGLLTNQKDTIFIESLFIKKGEAAKQHSTADILNVVGGYAFKMNGHTIGIVDIFKSSLSYADTITEKTKLIVTAAGTALLLRNR